MPVITIRGQLGSGVSRIARACAEALDLDYIDHEIIARVAERLRRPRQAVIAKEVFPATLTKRIAKAIKEDFLRTGYSITTGPGQENPFLDDFRYLRGLKTVLRELVRSGASIINGRGSQFLLKDNPRVLHVLVVSPLETRIKRLMETLGIDEKTARDRISRHDKSRRNFTKKYFKAELEDPVHYDLVINTERVGFETAVNMISRAASFKDRVLETY